MKRRSEWFLHFGKVNTTMWWIPVGHLPTLEEAVAQLAYLQKHGVSEQVFDFKSIQHQKIQNSTEIAITNIYSENILTIKK